jgi:3-hydroxyacyl-[acyl-carrier-protein] dehydratase
MPPQLLYDITGIDLDHIIHGPDAIREVNPHRGDMEMLQAVTYLNPDLGQIIGYKDVRDDEFWVPGHIPGRPLFPGVLMIETGAQLASFYTKAVLKWPGFVGFGGVDGVKFRTAVVPGKRLYIVGLLTWQRHRRIGCKVQGLVDGQVTFEAEITGAQM